jgi:K+-sensing histidine kinase KdpD
VLVTALCTAAAFAMSVLCRDYAVKAAVPVAFLLALVLAAHLAGRTASLVVAIAASLIFATYLFEPYGRLAIQSPVDRIDLLCFGLAAIALLRFAPSSEGLAKSASGRATMKTSDPLATWIGVAGYAVILTALITLLLQMWSSER